MTSCMPARDHEGYVRDGGRAVIRVLLALLIWCGGVQAATLEGTTFPDSYPVEGQSLVLNGLGLRTLTVLNIRVYAAGLYLAQQSHDPQQILASSTPKVLLLQFLRSGSKEQVARQFRAGEQVNCGDGGCDPTDQGDFDRMVAAAPAAKPGDTFTFVISKAGVRFYADNSLIFQSSKADLGRLILLGFIGNRPPSEDLRKGLLHLNG